MAPVRACLAGEDLDWLGGRCCGVALDLPTTVSTRIGAPADGVYLDGVLTTLAAACGSRGRLGLPLRVTAAAPIGSGLSTSSSLVIALARACAELLGIGTLSPRRLAEICYTVEHEMDQGGGMDHLTIIEGGVLLMSGRRDGLPDLLGSAPWPPAMGLVVISSGEPKSTSRHLHQVRAQLTGHDPALREYIAEADMAAARVWRGVVTGDVDQVAAAMNQAHVSMRDRQGMSTRRLEELRDIALGLGFPGVKITGAGGGGALVAVAAAAECSRLVTGLRERCLDRGPAVRAVAVQPVAPGWYPGSE